MPLGIWGAMPMDTHNLGVGCCHVQSSQRSGKSGRGKKKILGPMYSIGEQGWQEEAFKGPKKKVTKHDSHPV